MEDLVRYLDEIVLPTVADFEANPTSRRHAFLACVAVFHSIDYLAYPGKSRSMRQNFRRQSPDFLIVDDVAHAFKHVASHGRPKERLRAHDVINQGGSFSSAFSLDFDVSRVTIAGRPEVNLLTTVKRTVEFLRVSSAASHGPA